MAQPESMTQRTEAVAQLEALAREIASAISAIEKNDLAALASHIAGQEAICDRLAAAWPASAPSSGNPNPRPETMRALQRAQAELAYINKVYAAVVKRAQKNTALMASIYRGHTPGYGMQPAFAAKRQTWSCEV